MRRFGKWMVLAALALAPCVAALGQEGEVAPGETEPAEERPTKRIKMYAENWRWVPNVIRVAEGTRVVIDFVSRDASHSFVLKDYRIKVPLPERSEKRFEFVADKKGEFKWRCGRPCGDGCPKMVGKLIVE